MSDSDNDLTRLLKRHTSAPLDPIARDELGRWLFAHAPEIEALWASKEKKGMSTKKYTVERRNMEAMPGEVTTGEPSVWLPAGEYSDRADAVAAATLIEETSQHNGAIVFKARIREWG